MPPDISGAVGVVKLMADAMTTPCVLLDCPPGREPRVLHANPAFARMTGYARDELRGATVPDLSEGASVDAVAHRIAAAMRSGRPVRGVRNTVRKTGETYMCELVARPLHDEAGQVTHYLVFAREVRRRRGRPPLTGQRFEPVTAGEGAEDRLFALE